MKIYLAGGMRTEWRAILINRYPNWQFFDPCIHGLKDEQEFTAWDTFAIMRSDLVFAYWEEGNPGLGMSFEIGFAVGRGIPVVLADAKQDRYAGLCRAASVVWYHSLEDSFEYLDSLYRQDELHRNQ